MKIIKVLFVFVCMLFCSAHIFAAASDSATGRNSQKVNVQGIAVLKLFPDDTVQRFIKNYGKDSLVKLIDKRIAAGQQFILENADNIKYDLSVLEYIMVARHFKLKIDYRFIDSARFPENEYRMYDIDFGNTKRMIYLLDSAKAAGANMLQILKSQLSNDYVQYMIPFYCDKLVFDKEVYDTLFEYSKSFKINDKMQVYWKFAELNRKCRDDANSSPGYQNKLFKELFPGNNPKAFYLDTFPQFIVKDSSNAKFFLENPRNRELEDFYYRYSPLRMLAYTLYADDVNLKMYSDNLIYLLDAQQKNGSWTLAKKFNYFNSDPTSTMYAIWSLCEFRSKLLKE